MPIPRVIARLNVHLANPIIRRIAWWAPWFGVVDHVGRRSGTRRRTPVNVFGAAGSYTIALTYGRDSEWVKNVIAAGSFELETRRRRYHLVDPVIVHDPARRLLPRLVRLALG